MLGPGEYGSIWVFCFKRQFLQSFWIWVQHSSAAETLKMFYGNINHISMDTVDFTLQEFTDQLIRFSIYSITTWKWSLVSSFLCRLNCNYYLYWISVKGYKTLRSFKSSCSNVYLHIKALLPIEPLYINIYLYIHLSLEKPVVLCNLFYRVKNK